MSTEGKCVLAETVVAANDFRVAGALYKAVNAAGNFAADNDQFALGIALSQPNSGQHLNAGQLGTFKAWIGAAVNSAGLGLRCAASGWLTPVTAPVSGTQVGSSAVVVGRVLETGASGDLLRCSLDFLSAGPLTQQA